MRPRVRIAVGHVDAPPAPTVIGAPSRSSGHDRIDNKCSNNLFRCFVGYSMMAFGFVLLYIVFERLEQSQKMSLFVQQCSSVLCIVRNTILYGGQLCTHYQTPNKFLSQGYRAIGSARLIRSAVHVHMQSSFVANTGSNAQIPYNYVPHRTVRYRTKPNRSVPYFTVFSTGTVCSVLCASLGTNDRPRSQQPTDFIHPFFSRAEFSRAAVL
jgi:hypothetical protein